LKAGNSAFPIFVFSHFEGYLKNLKIQKGHGPQLSSSSSAHLGVLVQRQRQSPLGAHGFAGLCPYRPPSHVDLNALPTCSHFPVLPFHSIACEAAASPHSLSLCSAHATASPPKLSPVSRARVRLATATRTSLTPFLRMSRTQP
jgi:hypothetical protein